MLEEHQLKCEQSGRFVEAEMARQKVLQFKNLEKEKMLQELKNHHNEQKNKIDIEYKEELDTFNMEWDNKFADLHEKYESTQKEMIERFKNDQDQHLQQFEESYPKEPKPLLELINLQKMLEQAVKLKEYLVLKKLYKSSSGSTANTRLIQR